MTVNKFLYCDEKPCRFLIGYVLKKSAFANKIPFSGMKKLRELGKILSSSLFCAQTHFNDTVLIVFHSLDNKIKIFFSNYHNFHSLLII